MFRTGLEFGHALNCLLLSRNSRQAQSRNILQSHQSISQYPIWDEVLNRQFILRNGWLRHRLLEIQEIVDIVTLQRALQILLSPIGSYLLKSLKKNGN